MMLRRTPRRAALGTAGVVAIGIAVAVAPRAEAGPPSPAAVSVSPSSVVAGAPTTLTFTLATPGPAQGGRLTLTVPSGWAAPQLSNATAAGYASAGCGGVSVHGSTITLTGSCLTGSARVVSLANESNTTAGGSDFTTTATGALTGGQLAGGEVTVTVTPAVPAQMVFSQQPGNTGVDIEPAPMDPVWHPFDPPVAVTLSDVYGNLATGYPDTVTIVTSGTWNGSTTATVDPSTATATFTGLADGTGGCEIGGMTRTMTVDDTSRQSVSATSDPYCSRRNDFSGQIGAGG